MIESLGTPSQQERREQAILGTTILRGAGLPLPITSSPARLGHGSCNFRALSRVSVVGVVKLVTGAMVGILGLVTTWWALDLAMWTAAKDFREDCREQFQAFNVTSPECDKILRQRLRPPPTWRDYFKTDIPKVQSYRVTDRTSHDELGASEPIAKQYGDAVMCDTATLSFNWPLVEAVFEERWDFSATFEENCPCQVSTNSTAVGMVEVADVYAPHVSGPKQWEELGALMKLAEQELWRAECVQPWTAAQPSPEPLDVGGTAGIRVEIVEAFGIAFILASFAKGLFRWEFGKRTR